MTTSRDKTFVLCVPCRRKDAMAYLTTRSPVAPAFISKHALDRDGNVYGLSLQSGRGRANWIK
ncbi:MAG TPA: hypothetical protein VKC60_12290 [Opitutaceae bacterium]|nr:hypothetical protein [Opitutaceae bacterium]